MPTMSHTQATFIGLLVEPLFNWWEVTKISSAMQGGTTFVTPSYPTPCASDSLSTWVLTWLDGGHCCWLAYHLRMALCFLVVCTCPFTCHLCAVLWVGCLRTTLSISLPHACSISFFGFHCKLCKKNYSEFSTTIFLQITLGLTHIAFV